MKIFKYIFYLSVISLVSANFFGCSKSNVGLNSSNNESKAVVVSLSFNGDINSEDSPLTKATTDDLYGVQIQEVGQDSVTQGLFDNVEDMKVVLYTNKKYNITCTMIKNGKKVMPVCPTSYYFQNYNCYKAPTTDGFAQPFLRLDLHEEGLYTKVEYLEYCFTQINNAFSKVGPFQRFTYLDSAYVYDSHCSILPFANATHPSVMNHDTQNDYLGLACPLDDKYPEVDRFYGKLTNYTPTTYAPITLKRTGFGLKYKVTGVTDGSVSVVIKNSYKTFISKSDITADYTSEDKIFSFYNILGAWQYADTYTETVNLAVVWTRGTGFVQDLGNVDVVVKRNAMNTINISLTSSSSSAGLGITKDVTPMGGTTVTVPVG
jgi:hypothetical protein